MIGRVHRRLRALASWPLVVLLFLAFVTCMQLFTVRGNSLRAVMPPPTPPPATTEERADEDARREIPDSRFVTGYTAADMHSLYTVWGPSGRSLFTWTQLTLDVAFPLTYGLLMALLFARLWPSGVWRWAVLLPPLAAVFDLGENLTQAYLVGTYTPVSNTWATAQGGLVTVASAFTQVKFGLFFGSLAALFVGGLIRLFRRRRIQPTANSPLASGS